MDRLPHLAFVAHDLTWDAYLKKFRAMEGIVEEFLEGKSKRSPSAQFRVDPTGNLEVISTHDQVLGGENAQVFLGCRFPADAAYRLAIQEEGFRAAQVLVGKGVLGRFGIDFISIQEGDSWRHYAIEINLRKAEQPILSSCCSFSRKDATPGDWSVFHRLWQAVLSTTPRTICRPAIIER